MNKICFARNISFLTDASFFKRSVRRLFLVSLAVICHPLDMFHVEFVCASVHIFMRTLIFTNVCAIVFSNCVHDCTNNLFGWSRVQTPGLAYDLFCGSRVRFPDLTAWSCCGSRVRFLGPDHLFQAQSIRGLCHSPPSLEDQVSFCGKIKPPRGEKSY